MDLIELQRTIDVVPDILPKYPTFLQIAGFPHYENVISNILKFYFDPNADTHGVGDLMLKSLFEVLKEKHDFNLSIDGHIEVRREVKTTNGRIDLVIISDKWVIAIENKIKHILNNDLKEYSDFLDSKYENKEIFKIVLSVNKEIPDPITRFINIRYEQYIKQIEHNLAISKFEITNDYYVFLLHFILSIKHFYQPIQMKKEQIQFLIDNSTKIQQIHYLEQNFDQYINHRAHRLLNELTTDSTIKKGVWGNNDLYFLYLCRGVEYKIDCLIEKSGIYITLCNHANNIAKTDELQLLDIFKEKDINGYEIEGKLYLEGTIDFNINDEDLINKLNGYLKLFKISE